MKRLILAATLAFAVPAFAQDAASPPADTSAPAAAAPTDTSTPAATPDASAPAAAAAPAAAPADLPVCSRTVTDRCIEKGSAPRKSAKKKKK
jgi:hypothetical protein